MPSTVILDATTRDVLTAERDVLRDEVEVALDDLRTSPAEDNTILKRTLRNLAVRIDAINEVLDADELDPIVVRAFDALI